jgi:hypothetical protein
MADLKEKIRNFILRILTRVITFYILLKIINSIKEIEIYSVTPGFWYAFGSFYLSFLVFAFLSFIMSTIFFYIIDKFNIYINDDAINSIMSSNFIWLLIYLILFIVTQAIAINLPIISLLFISFLLTIIGEALLIFIDYKNLKKKRLVELSKELSGKLKEIDFPKDAKLTIEPSTMDLLNLYFYNGNLKDIKEVKSEAKKYLNTVIMYVDENSFLPKRSTNRLMRKIQDYNAKRLLESTFDFIHRYKDLLSENKKTYTYNEYLTLKKFDTVIYNLDALWNFKINL